MLAAYNPDVFARLNKFNVAKQNLVSCKAKLSELGALICRYSLQDEVGVSLLHKHFDVQPSERLAEEFAEDKIYISPCTEAYTENLTPYMWKLQNCDQTNQLTWYPLEFVHPNSIDHNNATELATALYNKNEFLDEMAETLAKMNLSDVFGISTLHRSILVHEDEIRLETTDHDLRTLTISAISTKDVNFDALTETSWSFTASADFEVSGMCSTHCFFHCQGHG